MGTVTNHRPVTWDWQPFAALSASELYDILQARQHIFMLEQQCLYADIDGADRHSWHLMGKLPEGVLVAYLRVLPPTDSRPEPAIGRVLVTPHMRGQGLGRQLLIEGIRRTRQHFPESDIVLSAQQHLEKLYQALGFASVSPPYLDDGIPHIDMRWVPSANTKTGLEIDL